MLRACQEVVLLDWGSLFSKDTVSTLVALLAMHERDSCSGDVFGPERDLVQPPTIGRCRGALAEPYIIESWLLCPGSMHYEQCME